MSEPDPAGSWARVEAAERALVQRWLELEAPASARGGALDALELVVGARLALVPLERLLEVVPMVWCDPVPGAPAWALGTFRYGPRSVLALDLGHILGDPPLRVTPALSVAVVQAPTLLGLVVAAVGEVRRLSASDIGPLRVDHRDAACIIGQLTPVEGPSAYLLSPFRLARLARLGDEVDP